VKSILADPLIAAKSERAVRCVASRLALGTRSIWELQGEAGAALEAAAEHRGVTPAQLAA